MHAVASITFRADQVVSGVAINMLGIAIALFSVKMIFDKGQTDLIQQNPRFDVPLLSEIPIIGPMFFKAIYGSSILAIAIAIFAWFIIYKTPFGLRLRSVGEHPMAADTMGINVAALVILLLSFPEDLLELVERFTRLQRRMILDMQLLTVKDLWHLRR